MQFNSPLAPTVPMSYSSSSSNSSLLQTPPRLLETPITFLRKNNKRALTPQKDLGRPSSSKLHYSSSPSSIDTPLNQFLLPSPTFFSPPSSSSRFGTPLKISNSSSSSSSSKRLYSYLNSPLKRSPASRNLTDFTFNAFAEDEEGISTSTLESREELAAKGKALFRGSIERGRKMTNWFQPSSNGKLCYNETKGLGIQGGLGSPDINYETGGYTSSSSDEEDFGGQEMRRALSEESKLFTTPSPLIHTGLQSKFKSNLAQPIRQALSSSFSSSSSIEISNSPCIT